MVRLRSRLTFLSLVFHSSRSVWICSIMSSSRLRQNCRRWWRADDHRREKQTWRQRTKERAYCIGDGGNDDDETRAADVGVFNLLLIHDGILIPP